MQGITDVQTRKRKEDGGFKNQQKKKQRGEKEGKEEEESGNEKGSDFIVGQHGIIQMLLGSCASFLNLSFAAETISTVILNDLRSRLLHRLIVSLYFSRHRLLPQ